MVTRKIRLLKKLISKRDIFRMVMSILLVGLTGWWSIPYAEAVRGYSAMGGEYCLIMMMGALPWFFSGCCKCVFHLYYEAAAKTRDGETAHNIPQE